MSRYSQYGYYDPVGSSQAQPTGYTYQGTTNPPSYPSAATSSGYGSNQQNHGSSGYGAQSYGNNAQSNSSTNHAAAALSSLGNQDYNQTSNRSSTGQYDNSQWYGSNAQSSYGTSNLQQPNRSQANNSPLYASTQAASTFGRLSVPDQQQSTSGTYGSSTYQNAPSNAGTNYRHQATTNQASQNPPQRYNSPLHAVQAQQSHQKQPSRGSNHQPSPQMANAVRYAQQSRQQSASVEPSPTTVDPSQVYDNRAELERKARADAERRKRIEAEQAAKKAEEDRLAAERKKVEEAEAADAAKKKEAQDRKNEQRKKAREEKRQSKSAATTLQQMATMGAESSMAAGMGKDEEAEMRAMFQKMREFNSKNPAMLAKLWEEERKQHAESSQSPQATPAPAPKTTHSRQSAAQAQPKSTAPPTKVPSQKSAQQAKSALANQASPPQSTPSRPAIAAPSSGTSLWPPHKKGALAEATAKWLMGLPQNAGKTISQQAVLNILNSNPSYVQLCESLENLDMRFERSTLARELLKAVPDGLRTQPKPTTPLNGTSTPITGAPTQSLVGRQTPQGTAAKVAGGPGTVSYSTPLSLIDAAREVNEMHRSASQVGGPVQPSQQSPYPGQTQTNGSRPPSQARAASQSQAPDIKPETLPEPPRAPADKEEAARKRAFGDLVDLTKEDDSDDDGPPPKKTFQLPSSGPVSAVNGAPQRDPLSYLQKQPFQQQNKPFNYQPKYQVPGAGLMNPPQRAQPIVPSNHQGPDTQPQPPQAQSIPPKPKGPTAEQLQQSRMRGKILVEPIMRDRVARKSRYDSSTIARDVLLATGRHPDMRSLNGHLNNMQKLLGHHGGEMDTGTAGTRCDLATINWDIIDPEQPEETVEKPPTAEPRAAAKSRPSSADPLAAPTAPMTSTVDYEAPFTSSNQVSSAPPKEKKKRGRKPKSMPMPGESMMMTNSGLGERASPNTPAPAPARAVTSNNTPNSAVDPALLAHANEMAAQGTPVGYSAFRSIGPNGEVIKKKGRPVGWKKHLHSREAQGLTPYPRKEGAGAKRGRPSKEAKEQALVEPQWQSFHCEWQGCKAELQNLDTLKKHMLKVHAREIDVGKGYECLWKGCDRQPGEGGGFPAGELEEWLAHVDKAHLQPIAWKQGDGPTGGSLGESPSFRRSAGSSPAYLNDAYGRSVTPIISPTPPPAPQTAEHQTQSGGTTTQLPLHPAPLDAPKRIGRPPKDGIPKLERDAGAELKKLQEHKRIVGPLMDRQGCVLASDARRRTFLGDEDFEDVVEGSEHEDLGAWD